MLFVRIPTFSLLRMHVGPCKRFRKRSYEPGSPCYDTIRYDSMYLTCSKKLTGSQLSLPHGINKKLKCKTKNKTMNVIVLSILLFFFNCIFAFYWTKKMMMMMMTLWWESKWWRETHTDYSMRKLMKHLRCLYPWHVRQTIRPSPPHDIHLHNHTSLLLTTPSQPHVSLINHTFTTTRLSY